MKTIDLGHYTVTGNPDNKPTVVVALINDSDVELIRKDYPKHIIVGWQPGVDINIINASSTAILDTVRPAAFIIDTPITEEEKDVCNRIGCKIIEELFGDNLLNTETLHQVDEEEDNNEVDEDNEDSVNDVENEIDEDVGDSEDSEDSVDGVDGVD